MSESKNDKELMYKAACFYHAEGLNVIPCEEREKKPDEKVLGGTWHRYKTIRSTPEEIEHWWANGHRSVFNIGIVHGEVSHNYITIDIDHDQGILDAMKMLHGQLFTGRIEQSGSGEGYHIPLRVDRIPDLGGGSGGKPRGNRTWKTELGLVNIRARWCQTVAPPSIHPVTGRRYRFVQKGKLTWLPDIDGVMEWLDKLAPTRTRERPARKRAIQSAEGDTLLTAVTTAWPTALRVFEEFGLTHHTKEESDNQVRLLGHGGLIIGENEEKWFCFSEDFGGGPIEAWGWCRFGAQFDKSRHFRQVMLEMGIAAGLDVVKFYRQGDELLIPSITPPVSESEEAAGPVISSTRYWADQYKGVWGKLR